jgi:hypothetical protein
MVLPLWYVLLRHVRLKLRGCLQHVQYVCFFHETCIPHFCLGMSGDIFFCTSQKDNKWTCTCWHAFVIFVSPLAVLGGSFLGTYISEKVIAYVGGTLFLVFAAATLVEIVR